MLKKFKNKKFISFITVAIIAVMLFVSCDSDSIESSSLESFFESESQTQSESVSQREPEDESSESVESESETQSSSESQLESSTVDQKITYEEFIEDYKDIANNFALDQIETISYIKDSLSTSYTFKVSGDQITGMLVANVVKTGETERELKVANINFIPAIHVDDIANDTIPDNTAVTIVSDTKYSFDAKDEYIDQTTDIEDKLETVIKAELGDFASHEEQYIQESFAPETVADLVADYGDTVNKVLNEKVYDKMIKACVPVGFDYAKVESAQWFIDGEDQITNVKFLLKYKKSSTDTIYRFANAKLSISVSIEEFMSTQNIEVDSVSVEYTFSYNPTTQGTRDDLVNAVFESQGVEDTGAKRLATIASSASLDPYLDYRTREVVVVEISEEQIIQYNVWIKDPNSNASDEQLIQNLKDGYYRVSNTQIIQLEGESLDYIPEAETVALSSKTIAAEAKTTVVSNKKKQKTEENIRSL